MAQPAVDDVDLLHPLLERFQAALDLGDHPGGDRAVGDQPTGLAGGEGVDQALGVVDIDEDAGDVGEDNELLGTDRRGHGGGRGVGVDIELAAVGAQRHRRDHRYLAGVGEVVDRQPIDPRDRADMAQIDGLAARLGEGQPLAEEDVRGEEIERHRPAAVFLEPGDEVMVELGGEDLLDDRQGGIVGVAPPLDKARGEPGGVHRPADRLPTTVDDHDAHPEGRHEDDVDEEVAEGIGVLNDTATEFDDGGRVAELADPPERLDEGVGFLDRLLLSLNGGGEGGHEEAFRESLRPSVGARKAAGGVAEREQVYQR